MKMIPQNADKLSERDFHILLDRYKVSSDEHTRAQYASGAMYDSVTGAWPKRA